jgi:site-specific recombinase XerD
MELFEQFIQERVYLKGVSPKTVISYQCAFKAFAGATETKTTMMHCDFDSLVVKVKGKGGKHRVVPLSTDIRKVLFRYAGKHSGPGRLMFGTRNNTAVTGKEFRQLEFPGRILGHSSILTTQKYLVSGSAKHPGSA